MVIGCDMVARRAGIAACSRGSSLPSTVRVRVCSISHLSQLLAASVDRDERIHLSRPVRLLSYRVFTLRSRVRPTHDDRGTCPAFSWPFAGLGCVRDPRCIDIRSGLRRGRTRGLVDGRCSDHRRLWLIHKSALLRWYRRGEARPSAHLSRSVRACWITYLPSTSGLRAAARVALVGLSGAGKSTVLRNAPVGSMILTKASRIDGVDLTEYPREARAHVFRRPDAPLFRGTMAKTSLVMTAAKVRQP